MSEILAPAGSKSCAIAAVNSGADAIYLGLDRFSARSSAENFNERELIEICEYARIFGVKVYVALNTVVKDTELKDFLSSAVSAWNAGADALIIQDIFLGKFIKENFPKIKLHLSTQAGVCNEYGAALAKEYGFDRVILARETKLNDIAKISEIIETEAFVQGALCTCFSGQCYLSSFIGGNSGNRGKCKQPCRKLYSIDRKGFEQSAYRLSLADLSVGEKINEYVSAGVSSFKIEGRLRRSEYVAAAINYYKSILNNQPSGEKLSDLKRSFNRGNYTSGLAFGQDKSFISSSVQGHIGEFAGIIKVENSKYLLQTHLSFSAGDGFKVLRDGREVGGATLANAVKGGYILSGDSRLKNGDKAFITTDKKLADRLSATKRSIPVEVKVRLFAGEKPKAIIGDCVFEGEEVLGKAQSRPLSAQEIAQNFNKTDDLPFAVKADVETDGVFVALSKLNAFRRSVYQNYKIKRCENKNIRYKASFTLHDFKTQKNCKTAIISTSLQGVKADIGILKPQNYFSYLTPLLKDFGGEKYLYLPPYLCGNDIKKISFEGFDGIYCEGYYGVTLAKSLNKKLFAGTGFNITNRLSLSLCPADNIVISKELTVREADDLADKNTFYLCEGGIKVMDLIYCPFEKKCATCDRRELYFLTDESRRQFPLRRYCASECAFELYNCSDLVPFQCGVGRLADKTCEGGQGFTKGHSVNGIY